VEVLLLLAVVVEQLGVEQLDLQLQVVLVEGEDQVQLRGVRQELQDKEILEETLPVQVEITHRLVVVVLVLLEEAQLLIRLPEEMEALGTLTQQGQVLLV
jgi:hypothetical protein